MNHDQAPLLLAVAVQNDELRQQLDAAQTLLLETAIEAGQLHARLEALQTERDAWRAEAERRAGRRARSA
jgi:F0F1-type ATP synthase membrane subunit b/b'